MATDGLYLGTVTESGERLRLDADDLTTHGLVVGMTGSGKTGLGVVLVEELLLAGVPVLVVDPKGDLANLALTFPQLRAEDFAPWVDGDDPAAVAERWREGLASSGLGPEQVQALRDAAPVRVYTPGSSAGLPVNLVGSLRRPAGDVDDETVADEVQGYVTGLLGLAGLDADPLASPEHILLSNLVHHAWAAGEDLDLGQLVGRVQDPPLRKLGVLDLESFIDGDARTELARRLNGLLASPTFAAWAEGAPLDIDALLRPEGADGRPGCAVLTLSHLSDPERQFVVAAVLGKLVTWVRRQPGTDRLRALLWFDEVLGFVPPTANPPAKQPLLTLLKQARAAGVGVVLATQNPVDVDYKGIANAGTWAIGRLQTEQDRDRLLEGMSSAGGQVDVGALADTIGGLAKRSFVLRQPGEAAPVVFSTRWALSYLRGPMTREQLSALGPAVAPTSEPAPAAVAPAVEHDETPVAPSVADGVAVRWLDPAAPWAGALGVVAAGTRLEAALALRLALTYDEASLDLRTTEEWEAVLHPLTDPPDVEAIRVVDHDDRDLREVAPDGARYVLPEAPIDTARYLEAARKAVVDQVVSSRTAQVRVNRTLDLVSRPGEDEATFAARCDAAADERADAEAVELRRKYEAKLARASDQLAAAADRVEQATAVAETRRTSELVEGAGSLLGSLLGGRRRARSIARAASGAATRRSRSREAATRVETARNRLAEREAAIADLEADLAGELTELAARWDEAAVAIEVREVALERADVRVVATALVWLPTGP